MEIEYVDGKRDLEIYDFTCPICGCRFKATWKDTIDPYIVAATPEKAVVEYSVICPHCTVRATDRKVVHF